jgi:hypothetical protein
MSSKQTLDSLFESAKAERSPVTAEDVSNILHSDSKHVTPKRTARKLFMSPIILIPSLAALAVAVGVTSMILRNKSEVGTNAVLSSSVSFPSNIDENKSGTGESASEHRIDDENTQHVQFAPIGGATDQILFFALRCDDAVESSLSIRQQSLPLIYAGLFESDSLKSCPDDSKQQHVKLCFYRDDRPDEVVFMDRPGPLPVMFTSSTGRGRVIGSMSARTIDANMLIPVASQMPNDDVVMWYQPDKAFMNSLPDSIEKDLRDIIEMEVRIEHDNGKLKIFHRERNSDGSIKVEETNEINMDSLVQKLNIGSALQSLNLDSTYNSRHIDSIFKILNFDSVMNSTDLRLDSIHSMFKTLNFDSVMNSTHIALDSVATSLKQLKDLNIYFRRIDSVDGFDSIQGQIEVRQLRIPASHTERVNKHLLKLPNQIHKSEIVLVYRKEKSPADASSVHQPALQESRTSEGALSYSRVYPNPTADRGATIAYKLTASRLLNLSLFDLSGTKLADLASNVRRSSGEGQIAFTLTNIPSGMYLVILTTDKNERVVHRLIVQ